SASERERGGLRFLFAGGFRFRSGFGGFFALAGGSAGGFAAAFVLVLDDELNAAVSFFAGGGHVRRDGALLAVALGDEATRLDVVGEEPIANGVGPLIGEDLVVLFRPRVVGVALDLDLLQA